MFFNVSKSSALSLFPALLFIIFMISACSSTEQVSESNQTSSDQTQMAEREQRNHAEMEAIFWERVERDKQNYTQADIDFMTGMIGHHAQALIMSRLAPENGASQSIQTLAARIINAQQDEIALMQRWLRDRNEPVPEVHIDGLNLMIHMEGQSDEDRDHGNHSGHGGHGSDMMHDHSDMPGMLCQEQLEELAEARGTEFDRLFLTYMIEHHEGAVIMVENLFAADGAASDYQSFELASGINADQVTEIERMKLMLENID
ncbi:DUF305 domain-containing protein [Rhodohalobacter halophilus]|uniref:DUF305 domain-containing protein n=1 Tax=Rhodohalobacter halophilus TaxID=1812810 RepID=UPI00083FD2F0|nr:DUF305 domain-containing protein [Rhodohalobacter halophilus]